MIERKDALSLLVKRSVPVKEALSLLSAFPWDFPNPLLELKREDITAALTDYLIGSATAEDIEQWANAIEGRDDIELAPQFRSIIASALHQLANPLLTKPLTGISARELTDQLS